MPKQFFIIDGYNFLHAAGMIPRSVGPETLSRSRQHLLRFLENRLTQQERINTTIVFDVHQLKNEITPQEYFAEMVVINAVDYPDADTCIEELIARHSAPKQLIVVSSDHRLHRAARKRKSVPLDSEDFVDYLRSRQVDQRETDGDKTDYHLQNIDYPQEDLPQDIKSSSGDLTDINEIELWEKRINELEQE